MRTPTIAGVSRAADVWMGLRAIVARRDGMRCVYCKVPTAATLEHVNPRSVSHDHSADNLRLACPLCNSTKGDEDIASWTARKGWLLDPPPALPGSVTAMLRDMYEPGYTGGYYTTGSTNSRVHVARGRCTLEVRPGRGYPWERVILGAEDHPLVVRATYDFLRRHYARRVGEKRRRTPGRRPTNR